MNELLGDRLTPAEAGALLRGAIDLHCHVNPHTRPEIHSQTALAYAEQARDAGMRAIVLSTDLGQAYSPVPVEGFRMFLAALLKCGVTPAEIQVMACRNPAGLLGLP